MCYHAKTIHIISHSPWLETLSTLIRLFVSLGKQSLLFILLWKIIAHIARWITIKMLMAVLMMPHNKLKSDLKGKPPPAVSAQFQSVFILQKSNFPNLISPDRPILRERERERTKRKQANQSITQKCINLKIIFLIVFQFRILITEAFCHFRLDSTLSEINLKNAGK